MSVIPPLLRLDLTVDLGAAASGAGVSRFIEAFVSAAAAAGTPAITSFASPVRDRKRSGGFDEWVRTEAEAMSSLSMTFGPRHTGTISVEQQKVSVSFGCGVEQGRFEQLTDLLRSCAAMVVALTRDWPVSRVTLVRQGEPGLACVPRPPVLGRDSHVAVVTSQEIAAAYENEEAVLAAWQDRQQISGRWVLFRGLESLANEDFLRILIDSQWALARAARPKLTKYVDLRLEPHEEAVYRAGSPTLTPVAHIAQGNVVEFTCTPPHGEFIRGWEVFNLRHLIKTGALDDGRKVETVRVMFLDKETAVANKRPLLDIGVRVAYADERGEPSYVED
jgi:hypothetical protein